MLLSNLTMTKIDRYLLVQHGLLVLPDLLAKSRAQQDCSHPCLPHGGFCVFLGGHGLFNPSKGCF